MVLNINVKLVGFKEAYNLDARSLVFAYNYDESELTKTVLYDDFDEVKLIGNIFDDNTLRNNLDFSDCPEIISIIRDNKINDLLC